jgi:hypothetical protein
MVELPPQTPGGHPFFTEGLMGTPFARFVLRAPDAVLISYSRAPALRYVTTRVRIQASRALAIADGLRRERRHEGTPKLYYVTPRTYRRPDGKMVSGVDVLQEKPLPMCLSWVIYWTGAEGPNNPAGSMYTCVDAETGEFLGFIGGG